MIYTTNDFNWLKNIVKNNQKLLKICNTKKKLFFSWVCIKWLIIALKYGIRLKFL